MADPVVIQLLDEFRKKLLELDAKSAQVMIQAYGTSFQRLSAQIDTLLAKIAGQRLTNAQVMKMARFKALQNQISAEMARFSTLANVTVTEAQASAVRLSTTGTRAVVNAALPPGIDTQLLDAVGINWNVMPADAFESFIGVSGDGSPLAKLLDEIGPTVRVGVSDALSEGIALGSGPRKTAALIRQRFGIGLTRALAISRTETLRAFRESTRLQYATNSNIVKGYRRRSAQSARTCFACIALDGKFYRLDEPLNEHVMGRCVLVPDTITYKDLGLNVEDHRPELGNARDWFTQQPTSVQRGMMGPGKFDAWSRGEFQLEEMATLQSNATWGTQAVEKTLKDLVA